SMSPVSARDRSSRCATCCHAPTAPRACWCARPSAAAWCAATTATSAEPGSVDDAYRVDVAVHPPALRHRRDDHLLAAGGRMHGLAVAQVDRDVIHAATDAVEQQVAGLGLVEVDAL